MRVNQRRKREREQNETEAKYADLGQRKQSTQEWWKG